MDSEFPTGQNHKAKNDSEKACLLVCYSFTTSATSGQQANRSGRASGKKNKSTSIWIDGVSCDAVYRCSVCVHGGVGIGGRDDSHRLSSPSPRSHLKNKIAGKVIQRWCVPQKLSTLGGGGGGAPRAEKKNCEVGGESQFWLAPITRPKG